MFQDPVGPQVLVHLTEMGLLLRVPARAGNARLPIHNDERILVYGSCGEERREWNNYRCCVATRIRHKPRAPYLVRKDFGEPIHRLLQTGWRSVLEAIPFWVMRRVLQPESATHVDDTHPRIQQLRYDPHRHIMLCGRENDVRPGTLDCIQRIGFDACSIFRGKTPCYPD